MPIPAYRAKQSTDTAGTGTIVLNAAATNARSFAQAFGASSRRVMYAISWASGFELGLGDFDGGTPGSLTRATVLASSNSGALVTLPAGTKDVFAVFAPAVREMVSISATSTLALADIGNAVVFTGSSAATLNLPAVATVPIGAGFSVWNNGTAALTIDPNGAETINGTATLTLQAGAFVEVLRLSVGWSASVPALPSSGGTLSGGLTIGGALLNVAGTVGAPAYSFASDSDTGIWNPAPNELAISSNGAEAVRITPTGLGVGISAPAVRLHAVGNDGSTILRVAGASFALRAQSINAVGVLVEATNPTEATYQPLRIGGSTVSLTVSGTPRLVVPASGPITVDGNALQIQRGTGQATTSGTAIDFTGIPAGVRRVTAILNGVSTNGSSVLECRLGTSGGIQASGYAGQVGGIVNGGGSSAINASSGLPLYTNFESASFVRHAQITCLNISGNVWSISVVGGLSSENRAFLGCATVTLSAALDRLRFVAQNGTDTFDAGAINIMWEF